MADEDEIEILPTDEEAARFWSLLEDAWSTTGEEANAARRAITTREPGSDADDQVAILDEAVERMVDALRAVFANPDCPQSELVAMDRVLERALYDIDREDVHAVTDGSDDGFLYARGFIVAMGKAYYDAVAANPAMGIPDAECESILYLPAQIHADRFGGEYPETGSGISRETNSNADGWD